MLLTIFAYNLPPHFTVYIVYVYILILNFLLFCLIYRIYSRGINVATLSAYNGI